jgi:hypothetical protein
MAKRSGEFLLGCQPEGSNMAGRWEFPSGKVRTDDCTLDLDDLASKLFDRTRLLATGYASNAVGTKCL